MKNEYKDMFKYLEDNELGVTSLYIRIVENMDLTAEDTLIKAKEIIDRYENSPNKFSEGIMVQLRQRRGLDEYDTVADGEINKTNKDDVLADLFMWNGLRGWDYTVKGWIEEVYGIKLSDESEEK